MYQPDEREVCVCFHVPLHKLTQYYRVKKPRLATQLSECFGAGTGCGWCIPFLEQIFEQCQRGETPVMKMSAEEYRRRRREYRQTLRGRGTGEPLADNAETTS